MSLASYSADMGILLLIVAPPTLGASRFVRRLLPQWQGPIHWLGTSALTLFVLVLTASLLGAAGLFERWPMAIAGVCEGALLWLPTRSPRPMTPVVVPATNLRMTVAAAILALSVAGEWTASVVSAARQGPIGIDTVQYHLPAAARFLQTGFTTHLHYTSLDAGIAFYPANSDLVHALAMLPFHRDLLSPFINIGWLALALLASWCIGRPNGRSPLTLAAMSVVCAVPLMPIAEAGAATNDIAVVALIATALALLVSGATWSAAALAGLAGGLALGTKPGALFLVAAITVWLWIRDRSRWPVPLAWTASTAVSGGFWFARNLVAVGNPIPSVHIPGLPAPVLPVSAYEPSVAHFLTDRHFLLHVAPSAAEHALGVLWPVLLLACGVGAIILCIRDDRSGGRRLFGVTAVVGLSTYLITPDTAGGTPSNPFLFGPNLRYVLPAVFVGLIGLTFTNGRRNQWAILLLFAMLCLSEEWVNGGAGRAWSDQHLLLSFVVVVVLSIALVLAGSVRRLRQHGPGVTRFAIVIVLLMALGAGYGLQRSYFMHRYTSGALVWPILDQWASQTRDARIGVVGFAQQYPLDGPDLSNFVQYVGEPGPHGAFLDIPTCSAFVAAVDSGRYQYVVTGPYKLLVGVPDPESAWMSDQPGARLVIAERPGPVRLWHLTQELSPGDCR